MGFYPFAGGSQGLVAPVNLQGAAGANPVFGAGQLGDTSNRVELDANGRVSFSTGGAPADTFLFRNSAGEVKTNNALTAAGNFAVQGGVGVDVQTAGAGLKVAEGSNAKQGTAVLVAGTVTVANTAVTANSRIMLTSQVDGGTPGFLRVSARVAGTSFTITSGSGADTSTVAYEIFEPG